MKKSANLMPTEEKGNEVQGLLILAVCIGYSVFLFSLAAITHACVLFVRTAVTGFRCIGRICLCWWSPLQLAVIFIRNKVVSICPACNLRIEKMRQVYQKRRGTFIVMIKARILAAKRFVRTRLKGAASILGDSAIEATLPTNTAAPPRHTG